MKVLGMNAPGRVEADILGEAAKAPSGEIRAYLLGAVHDGTINRLHHKWLTLRLSAVELLSVAGLFGLIALAGGGWAFFGGAAFNLITGLQQWALSDQARHRTAAASPAA